MIGVGHRPQSELDLRGSVPFGEELPEKDDALVVFNGVCVVFEEISSVCISRGGGGEDAFGESEGREGPVGHIGSGRMFSLRETSPLLIVATRGRDGGTTGAPDSFAIGEGTLATCGDVVV